MDVEDKLKDMPRSVSLALERTEWRKAEKYIVISGSEKFVDFSIIWKFDDTINSYPGTYS